MRASIDETWNQIHRSDPRAIGAGIKVLDPTQPHKAPLRVYLKAIVRDGLEHIFVYVNDENLATLVLEDGKVVHRHDLPS